jgi:hypothetical protein
MASILCRIEGNLIYLRNQGIRVVVPSKCHQPASRPFATRQRRGFPEMAVAVGPFVAGLDQHPNGTGPQDSSLRGRAVNRPCAICTLYRKVGSLAVFVRSTVIDRLVSKFGNLNVIYCVRLTVLDFFVAAHGLVK